VFWPCVDTGLNFLHKGKRDAETKEKKNLRTVRFTLIYVYTLATFISIPASAAHRYPEKRSDDFKKDHSQSQHVLLTF